MRKHIIEIAAAIALTLGAILASAPGVLANDVMVISAFARASATPSATTAAAYLTLTNHGGQVDRLTAVTTEAADMAHIHSTTTVDGVTSMGSMGVLEIGPGQTVSMQPGGTHIMLMGLKAPLKKGSTLTLVLTFEKAGQVMAEVPVGGVAANGPGE
jgi:copper(I)-binding protein